MRKRHVPPFPLAVGVALAISGCLDPGEMIDPGRSPQALVVANENLRPGSLDWDANLYWGVDSTIAGYGLPFSLRVGDTLHLFVTARLGPVSVSIHRLGWYRGRGARLVARHAGLAAPPQPPCSTPSPGPSVCPWSETDRFIIDRTWPSGVYLAVFGDGLGRTAAFPFVVRSERTTAFVVVLPYATYQAYNAWGGANLYGGPGATPTEVRANRAVKVSFARPFTTAITRGPVLGVDYLLVRWLEANGYDVSYVTDYDFDASRGPAPFVAWLFAGHSEYWTWAMWQRAKAARDQGLSLGFIGGNDAYWVIRFEHLTVQGFDAPVVVCYKDAAQDPLGTVPGLATTLFRAPPNNAPENALVGVMHEGRSLIKQGPIDLVVVNGADPLLAGTGLQTGAHVPRVTGWEADRIVNNGQTPPGIRVLFDAPFVPAGDTVPSGLLQATVYTWPTSGALVFAGGAPGFPWGLATYRQYLARPPLERFLRNLLAAFVAARPQY